MDRKPDPRPGFAAFTPRRTCATAGDMPDFKKLLRTAVAETLAMQRRPFDDWRREGRLLAPSIMGLAAEGSYRTSRAGIEALAELAEGFRRVDKARARSVSEKSAFLAANITLGEMLPSLGRDLRTEGLGQVQGGPPRQAGGGQDMPHALFAGLAVRPAGRRAVRRRARPLPSPAGLVRRRRSAAGGEVAAPGLRRGAVARRRAGLRAGSDRARRRRKRPAGPVGRLRRGRRVRAGQVGPPRAGRGAGGGRRRARRRGRPGERPHRTGARPRASARRRPARPVRRAGSDARVRA